MELSDPRIQEDNMTDLAKCCKLTTMEIFIYKNDDDASYIIVSNYQYKILLPLTNPHLMDIKYPSHSLTQHDNMIIF